MKGVLFKEGENHTSLSISDVGEVPVWREQIKKCRKELKKQTLPSKERKQLEDDIVVLDTYIFLSGVRYSLRGGQDKYT